MVRLPLYLLLLILPLAVAGQNIGTGVATVLLFLQIYQRRRDLGVPELKRRFGAALALSLLFIAVLVAATALNPDNPGGAGSLAFGHLIWALLPAVVCLAQPRLDEKDWYRLLSCLGFAVLVMGGVALSQNVWGWKFSGSQVVASIPRSQGFYSHPLTFAYVGLLLWPLGCAAVARLPRHPGSWALFLGGAAVVYGSQSRTVQAVCACVLLFNVLYFARQRMRLALIGLAAAGTLALALTNNPVRERFGGTLTGHDVRSGYADDRLAFWHANWEMLKDRPLLGHGDHLNKAYRAPYYERIGLAGFERMYEAHNMYLQVAVNAGVIGLAIFLAWLVWYFRLAARLARGSFGGKVALATLAALCLGASTQNAFQDAEVRYALTLLITAIWLLGRDVSAERFFDRS